MVDVIVVVFVYLDVVVDVECGVDDCWCWDEEY